jgi:nicotinamidase-related amidase
MPIDSLPTTTALVLVDLQVGITALPTITPADAIVEQAATLTAAFRTRALPVVLVTVGPSPDGGDALKQLTDTQPPAMTFGPDFADLRPELGEAASDLHIRKRQWDAFFGTELDLQLRRRGITTIVYGGLLTSIGVESTARAGFSHGYEAVFASDAISDVFEDSHERAFTRIFPRLGRIATTDEITAALG